MNEEYIKFLNALISSKKEETNEQESSEDDEEEEEEEEDEEEDEEDDEDEDEVDYDELSLKELKAECKTRGLKVPKGSDKDDLVELLETDDEE